MDHSFESMKALGWGGKGGKDSDALRKVEVKTVKLEEWEVTFYLNHSFSQVKTILVLVF